MTDESPSPPTRSIAFKFFRALGGLIRWTVYLLGTLWAFGAIYFDGPSGASGNLFLAITWVGVTLTYLFFLRGGFKRFFTWLACMAVVLVPFLDLQPSNERDWHPDFAQTGSATIDGDTVTLHNFRNFDYTVDGTVTERWEDRTVHLSNLKGIDYFQDNFFGQLLSHPILSFDFGEDGHIALSIETRREKGERFSVFAGLYKTFELQQIFGDESDLIRVRTNIRKEPVRLYQLKATPADARQLFLASVQTINELHATPRFYNVISSNCTTGLRALTPAENRMPWDYRILLNGRLHEVLYEHGILITADLSLEELEKRSFITETAQAAHDDPDFSKTIRQQLPKGPGTPPVKEPAPSTEPAPETPAPAE